MSETRRGRAHDAEGAREAILDAAEQVFAEHGYDGARIAAIAEVAGYNSSLLFQYFGDKLGLYVAVLIRSDREMTALQERVLTPLIGDMSVASDPVRFEALLETVVGALFDFLVEHPRLMRMLQWEMAEGWQTYIKVYSQFPTEDIDRLEAFFRKAQDAGLLRSELSPTIQITTALQICQLYLASLPLYRMMRPEEDFSSPEALARGKAYVVAFIVAGMLTDPTGLPLKE